MFQNAWNKCIHVLDLWHLCKVTSASFLLMTTLGLNTPILGNIVLDEFF